MIFKNYNLLEEIIIFYYNFKEILLLKKIVI